MNKMILSALVFLPVLSSAATIECRGTYITNEVAHETQNCTAKLEKFDERPYNYYSVASCTMKTVDGKYQARGQVSITHNHQNDQPLGGLMVIETKMSNGVTPAYARFDIKDYSEYEGSVSMGVYRPEINDTDNFFVVCSFRP